MERGAAGWQAADMRQEALEQSRATQRMLQRSVENALQREYAAMVRRVKAQSQEGAKEAITT